MAETTSRGTSTNATQYRRSAYQFIAFYRYVTFAVAAALMIALPLSRGQEARGGPLAILAVVGLYTAFKIVFPIRESRGDLRSYAILVIDAVVCLWAVMLTGGLDSGLLLYSFTPVVIAASFYSERTALAVAGVYIAALGLGHIVLSQFTQSFTWILLGNLLSVYAAYAVACFLVATVAYRANLNIRQRIERSSIIDERRRLRREIHDGIAQSLGYLNLKTSLIQNTLSQGQSNTARVLAELDDMKRATEEAYTDIRESIDSLTLAGDSFSLATSLSDYLREFSERTGIQVDFQGRDDGVGVSPLTDLQALRIAQEALRNVRKHANATKVEVALRRTPESLELTVRDNGKGMADPTQVTPGHHGLEVMRERAESLGGTLSIRSEAGKGTEVKMALPVGRRDRQ